MINPVKLEVNTAHSCNWRCCLGCRDVVKVDSPKQISPASSETETVETVTKVTHVYHHRHPGQSQTEWDEKYP